MPVRILMYQVLVTNANVTPLLSVCLPLSLPLSLSLSPISFSLLLNLCLCVSDTIQHHYGNHCISFDLNIIAIVTFLVTAVASLVVTLCCFFCICCYTYICVCVCVCVRFHGIHTLNFTLSKNNLNFTNCVLGVFF